MDPRYFALARNLVTHSTHIEKGENVLIHSFDIPEEMTIALIRAVKEKGGHPYSQIQSARVDRECILGAYKEQLEVTLGWELERMLPYMSTLISIVAIFTSADSDYRPISRKAY